MWPNFSQSDDLVMQSYFSFCLLAELTRDGNLVKSEYFKNLHFDNQSAKIAIQHLGVDNQGCLLMCLYALLVIPKQLLQQMYPKKFSDINDKISQIATSTTTTYAAKPSIDYLRHIRNAVSHARVTFDPQKAVEFQDANNKGGQFKTVLPLTAIPKLLEELQQIHITYIRDKQGIAP